MKQRLAILGSTGSIGVQTLDIARENPGRFEVRVLTANRNWERLARQAREFDADAAVIADKQHYAQLRDALAGTDTKVYAGEEAVAAFLARKCAWLDIVRAIRYALEHAAFVPSPTLADYAEANAEARALAAEFLQLKN